MHVFIQIFMFMIKEIVTYAALALGLVSSSADAMKMGEHFVLDVVGILGNQAYKVNSKELEFPKGNQMGPEQIAQCLSQLGEEVYEGLLKTGIPHKIYSDFDYRGYKEFQSKANRYQYNTTFQPWLDYFAKGFVFTDQGSFEPNGVSLGRNYDLMAAQKGVMMKEFCTLQTIVDLAQNGANDIALLARVRVLKD